MTEQAQYIFGLFDTLAARIPALDDSQPAQAAYDAALPLLPELIAAAPSHPLSRLLLRELARLEAQGATAATVAAFDIPGYR